MYIKVASITRMQDEINKFKLFFTTSYSTGAINFPEIVKGMPGEVCTETFLRVGPFETQKEQENCFDYMHTKFSKFCCTTGKVQRTFFNLFLFKTSLSRGRTRSCTRSMI